MRASGSGTSPLMRARHRRSSALDHREQGRSRGVRRTSTSIHHDQRQGFRVEAKFPFLSGHSEWDAPWLAGGAPVLEIGHGRFRAAHGDIGHIRHISTSGTSGPMLSRALGGGETGQGWDGPRTRRQASGTDGPSFSRAGHPSFGDISFISVVRNSPFVAQPPGAALGHRMATAGRGAATVLMCRCIDRLDRDQLTRRGLGRRPSSWSPESRCPLECAAWARSQSNPRSPSSAARTRGRRLLPTERSNQT